MPAWPQLTINSAPAREFGQHSLVFPITSASPNLIEGRELNAPSSIAFDTSVSPPILYVSDTGNNRILAWRDPDKLGVCSTASAATCGRADLVIGQPDMFSSFPQGPGTQGSTISAGFNTPAGIAVDSAGNLYVVDAGNNRILRFPAPFQSAASSPQVDLVIGQPSVSSGALPNQGQTSPSAQSLAFSTGGAAFRASIAFDSSGNLWVTDPGNNRVLRFPGPNSASNQLMPETSLPSADLVLGQPLFSWNTAPANPSATRLDVVFQPIGLAFDLNGGLYVLDGYSRVLYFLPSGSGYQTGQPASRVLGIVPQSSQSAISYPNPYSVGVPNQGQAQGIFTVGNALYVCDSESNRVVNYDVPANWPAATAAAPSPAAIGVVGQADLDSGTANKGQIRPDATTLNGPAAGAALHGEIWVVDSLNHRVLAYPSAGAGIASRVVGQLDFAYNAVNLIEGREVSFNSATVPSAAIAVDASSDPPRLYIADSQNNRILGFKDARNIQAGATADLVIGQPDFYSSLVNYPSGNAAAPTSTGLHNPIGLAVDSSGNLLVADSANGRVLRFPSPFRQPTGTPPTADLVLGQTGFTSQILDATQRNMSLPFGLALFSDGSVAVSDASFNRVVIFQRPAGGDFTNGQLASRVVGQPDFATTSPGSSQSLSGLNSPRHIAVDTSDRLYVCDGGNDRVSVFSNGRTAPNGSGAVLALQGLNAPQGIAVNASTGEFWVANTNQQQLLHFSSFESALLTGQSDESPIPSPGPIAVAIDSYGNLIAAELANRVSFYFPQLAYRNAANYNTQPVAPGSLIYVARPGVDFSFTPGSNSTAAWADSISGIEVLMNGSTPSPIYQVTSTTVYFEVPMSAPTSGFADFQVINTETGQIYADSELPMGLANPGFFTLNAQGFGQAAAVNVPEGTVNGPSHPVSKDGHHYIQFYLTGQGFVPGAPPDGEPASQAISTPTPPIVLSTGCIDGVCPASSVSFSGIGAFPGVWLINFLVPNTFPSGCDNVIAVVYDNAVSNTGPNGKLQVTFCTQ